MIWLFSHQSMHHWRILLLFTHFFGNEPLKQLNVFGRVRMDKFALCTGFGRWTWSENGDRFSSTHHYIFMWCWLRKHKVHHIHLSNSLVHYIPGRNYRSNCRNYRRAPLLFEMDVDNPRIEAIGFLRSKARIASIWTGLWKICKNTGFFEFCW